MTYDFILMNPPYGSIGGPVTTEAKNYANKTVCLMPLSCYKAEKNELYRYVDEMGLADPEMFEDVSITNNLCICTLRKDVVDRFKTYEEMAMESYDPKFKAFYEVNKHMPKYINHLGNLVKKENVTFDRAKTFIYLDRTADHGVHKSGYDVLYNNSTLDVGDIPVRCSNQYQYFFIDTKTHLAKTNLATFWYKGELQDKLIHGIHKAAGTCEIAIPQIDWEAISDTPLWKEGKYDEAVLDVMGLKWDGDVIVEK